MVKKMMFKDKKIYECEECKLRYKNRKYAKKCEEWCKKNKSCNIDITKYAIINKRENES